MRYARYAACKSSPPLVVGQVSTSAVSNHRHIPRRQSYRPAPDAGPPDLHIQGLLHTLRQWEELEPVVERIAVGDP